MKDFDKALNLQVEERGIHSSNKLLMRVTTMIRMGTKKTIRSPLMFTVKKALHKPNLLLELQVK